MGQVPTDAECFFSGINTHKGNGNGNVKSNVLLMVSENCIFVLFGAFFIVFLLLCIEGSALSIISLQKLKLCEIPSL